MRKSFLVLFICTLGIYLFPEQAQAQRRGGPYYETSAGLRLSPWYGASIKHFFQGVDAVEGILHSSWDAMKVTGLYERHMPAFEEPGLMFYFGGGAHVGFGGNRYFDYRYNESRGSGLIGIDGVIGVEYVIQEEDIPLNVSLDWKPLIEFASGGGFWGNEIGLTVRYIFRY